MESSGEWNRVTIYWAAKDLGISEDIIRQIAFYNPPDYIYGVKLDGAYTRQIRPDSCRR